MDIGAAIGMVLSRLCDRSHRFWTNRRASRQNLWANGLGLVGGDGNNRDRDGIATIGSNFFSFAKLWELGSISKFATGITIAINRIIFWVCGFALQYPRISHTFGLGVRLRKFTSGYRISTCLCDRLRITASDRRDIYRAD